MSKLIFLKALSQYQSHTVFLNELKAAFERLGKEVAVVDVNNKQWPKAFEREMSPSVDFIFSYNALALEGVIADLYGAGDADRPPLKSHRLHGQADLSEIIKLMGRARMTLNVGPNFCNGSHERVFSAMLNGALAVTDANAYWRGEFMEGEGILMYEWARLSELAGKIEYFLSRPAELSEATEAGAQKARENHTALNRARRMLEIVDMVGKTPPTDAETL